MYTFPNPLLKCKTLAEINNSGGIVKINDTDDTVMVYYNGIPDYKNFNSKSCCELLGYNFDIDTQKCTTVGVSKSYDCITKLVYNPKDNDGVNFNINDGETCGLSISLDYLLNFDCNIFSKNCTNNENNILADNYKNLISAKEKEIRDKNLIISNLESKLLTETELFNGLCYVIKGNRTSTFKTNNDTSNVISEWISPWLAPTDILQPKINQPPIAPVAPAMSSGPNQPSQPSINSSDAILTNYDTIPTFSITETTNLNDIAFSDIIFRGVNPDIINNILPLSPLFNPINFKSTTNNGINPTNSTIPENPTPPPPFAWIWKMTSTTFFNEVQLPINRVTRGPVSYCLTERGKVLWEEVLGESKYSQYIASFGCPDSDTYYSSADFDKFLSSVSIELTKDLSLSLIDFVIETKQGQCDKNNVNKSKIVYESDLNIHKNDLIKLKGELDNLNKLLTDLNLGDSFSQAISNLETLKIYLNLEYYDADTKKYVLAFEDKIFDIGENNLLSYILTQSPNTGILISGSSAGGILSPESSTNVENNCNTNRTGFMQKLYLEQYKGAYPDPIGPAEILALNKKMNAWYNSSWLAYGNIINDEIVQKIKNKKIKLSLKIETCCLDLCVLTDNLVLSKNCESLDNEEIIISESPKFEIEKVLDNKKSWVSYTENTSREHDLQFRETQYNIDDYRLSINTKEIDLKIDGANAIEEDVLYNVACLLSGSTGVPSCKTIDLDTFLTTELVTINNVDEFRKAVISELIDTKNRQTLSSYPTLRLLYERYLGYCTDCNKNGNKFTYASMDTFIDLIGKHWVDLVEQFVPATTIWGATDVYRNMVFHQQKHIYRRSNLEFKRQVTDVNTIIGFEPLRTIENTYQSIIYDVSIEQMPEKLEASASTINFQAASQIDDTPRANPDTPIVLNLQVGSTTQTFGELTDNQLRLIQSQIDSLNKLANSSNVFEVKRSINYGLSSGPGHNSPIFYGKITHNNLN
jgi:hypothetical protein